MITVILQGYTYSKQTLNLIVDSYIRFGYVDIIVSSYSWCIDEDYLKNKVILIKNDDLFKEIQEFNSDILDKEEHNKPFRKHRLNVNYQIATTFRGIEEAQKQFPGNNFIIKQRCDIMLLNPVEVITSSVIFLNHIIERDNKKEVFDVGFFRSPSTLNIDWFIRDWFYLGFANDIYRLFNIPKAEKCVKPETYITSSYVNTNYPNLTWEEFKQEYCFKWRVPPILYWYKFKDFIHDFHQVKIHKIPQLS